VGKRIIKDYKVLVEFGLVINDTRLKVKVGLRGSGDVVSSTIDLVAMPSDVVDEAI
jgi:hypothetical protein